MTIYTNQVDIWHCSMVDGLRNLAVNPAISYWGRYRPKSLKCHYFAVFIHLLTQTTGWPRTQINL